MADYEDRTFTLIQAVKDNNTAKVFEKIAALVDVNLNDNEGNSALLCAVQQRNNDIVVRALIDAGADVNTTNNEGKTALFYAVERNDNEGVVQALIDAGADVNITDDEGKTTLFYAVHQSNNERMVHALIDAGVDVNITSNDGKTALFYAAETCSDDIVHLLIENQSDINIIDIEYKTALIHAVINENASLVQKLIGAGADFDKTDNQGKTALAYAVRQSNNESMVSALIDAGADVNITDDEGKTAFLYAVEQNDNEGVVQAMIDAGANVNISDGEQKTALTYAVLNENESLVRKLITSGADVDAFDGEEKTALIHAVLKENGPLVQALIDAGADVKAFDGQENTVLISAVLIHNESLVGKLIAAGANVNIPDIERRTALFHAAQWNNQSVVGALIAAGADVNISDKERKTALFYAVQQRDSEKVVHALIDSGADVNISDEQRKTALFYAVQQRDSEKVVRALIDAGADVNTTDNNGDISLIYAVRQTNNESVVRALIDAGANVNRRRPVEDFYDMPATLTNAVRQSSNESVIDAGADVNDPDIDGQTALLNAVKLGYNESVLRSLINAGAHLNVCDPENKTALMHAVQDNNEAAAVTLIKAGADVNKRDKMLKTCLIYATLNENECLMKALIKASANVNATDINLKSPLIYAACSGNDRLVRALIKAGAYLNITDIGKKTALIRAIENDNIAAANALIKAGADLNICDKWMKTALIHAVLCDNEKLVRALISRGANVNAPDRNKQTALTHAIIKKSENIALTLIDAGTDVNLADDNSKTPLIYAAENDQDYFCFTLVDNHAVAAEDSAEDESKTCSTDAVANNFQDFICECFALITEKIPEDVWLSGVEDELKKKGEANEDWFQAYRNVRLHCQVWENILVEVIRENKHLVKTLVDKGSSFTLSEHDIDDAISCTARMEHEILVQGSTSLNERENKGLKWIEEFLTRITSSERKLTLINSLLKAGADVNQRDIDGRSVLIHALLKGKKHLAKILIECGAKVNNIDETGRTALIYAVKNNESKDIVESLINAGAEMDYTDNKGKTALIYAVHNEDHSLAQALIEAGANVNITDTSSKSALIYAVKDEKEWLTNRLIKNGADVKITDGKCRTPLMYAVQNKTEYLARALIDAGSEVNATDIEYKTALIHAVQNKNDRLASILISQGSAVNVTDNEWRTALIHAAKNNGDKDLVHSLITAGTDVDIFDKEEKTALIYAVQNENGPLTTTLITAGTDVNITDNEEATALIYAIQNKNEILANELIEAGTEVNFADFKKKTALIYAVQHQLEDITVDLIDAGADVHATDDEGKTALFYAVQNEFLVSTLIKAGADANANDNHSRTPLFAAVANEFVVRQLVEDGKCGVKSKDIYGRTPLCYALTKSLSSSHYLLQKEEKIDSKDFCGLSSLSFLIDSFLLRKISEDYLVEGLKFFVGENVSFSTVFQTIIDAVFCKILSSYSLLTPVTDLLMLARRYAENTEANNIIIQKIPALMTLDQVPSVLPLLIALGANPNSVDSGGNTALHYAACLPFAAVSQETVKKICSQLEGFGVLFNIKNHLGETPLLFSLKREVDLIKTQKQKHTMVDVNELVYVWEFLLEHGASVEETTADGQSTLHLVLNLFDQGFRTLGDKEERNILGEALRLFDLFASAKITKGFTVNRRGRNLNSPLHLLASLRLNSDQMYNKTIWETFELEISEDSDYEGFKLNTFDFKKLLIKIFHNLQKCGVQLNDRNAKEETPLHLSRTWTAVELMLDAGANPNDMDVSGCPPLLAAAKKRKFGQNSFRFYPDFIQEPEAFWNTVLKKGLDPWTVDKNGESVFSILIASEAFILAKALVDVASKKNYVQSNTIALSLLNAICKDESTRAHWKSTLVEKILKSRKFPAKVKSGQDTPLHYCCRNILKTPEESTVHWTIAKLLLSGGTDYRRIPNEIGKTCFDIAESSPTLKELLMEPINIYDVPLLIPWMSVSERYQPRLAEAARRQNCWHVDPYWCHENPLDSGSFGIVFAGINEKDGREVAIKRIEKQRMKQRENKREIQNLTALADCEQVVRYLSFSEDEHFCYLVLELMEGNLDDCLESSYSESETLRLCKDVVKGLRFLHEHGILHRDLKPTNILYRCHPKLCLKIADFGLSRRIDSTGSTVYGTNVGTRCWIAPEVLNSFSCHSESSDIFACGLLIHYTLSGKMHPFSSAYCEIKSVLKTNSEIETNILEGNMDGFDESLSPEAAHLLELLLLNEETERPTATATLAHPLFWTKKKKLDLLVAVGNQPEISCPRFKVTSPTDVENDLEVSWDIIVKHVKWNDQGYGHMPAIYTEMMAGRKYDPLSIVDLVRFIRNAVAHVSESTRPTPIKKQILEDFVFLEYFPNLVMEVYKAVTTHGWDQTREEIKYAMKK